MAASKHTASTPRDDSSKNDAVSAESSDDVQTGTVTAGRTPDTNPPSDTGTVHSKNPEDAEASQQSGEQYDRDVPYDNTTVTGSADADAAADQKTYADDERLKVDDDPRLQPVDNHPDTTGDRNPVQNAPSDYLANQMAAGSEPEGGPEVPTPVWTGQALIYNPDSPVPASPHGDPPPMIYDPPASSLPPGRILPRADVVTNPPAVGEQVGKSTAVAALEASDDFVHPDEPRPTVAAMSAASRDSGGTTASTSDVTESDTVSADA